MRCEVIFATGNLGKAREVHEMMAEGMRVHAMSELGLNSDPEETGTTFEENSLIKARALYEMLPKDPEARRSFAKAHGLDPALPMVVLADDSGLVVDALDGLPGIYSARYMGRDTSYEEKMNHILEELRDVPEEGRSARFIAAISAILPDGTEKVCTGVFEGRIGHEIKGSHGFGYDPIFYLPERGLTSAEILPEEKNRISHRALGIRAMVEYLAALPEA